MKRLLSLLRSGFSSLPMSRPLVVVFSLIVFTIVLKVINPIYDNLRSLYRADQATNDAEGPPAFSPNIDASGRYLLKPWEDEFSYELINHSKGSLNSEQRLAVSDDHPFGLYSYLLFGTKPADAEYDNYLALIRAFLVMTDEIEDLKRFYEMKRLNASFLPIITNAPSEPSPEWVLNHYDFVRAKYLLKLVATNQTSGIYFITLERPLTRILSETRTSLLWQDLTAVKPSVSQAWLAEILEQVRKEHFTDIDKFHFFLLRVRNRFAQAAADLPEIKKAVSEWLSIQEIKSAEERREGKLVDSIPATLRGSRTNQQPR